MRKLREAAVVALMVGSVGMLGAGTAAAHVGKGTDGRKVTSHAAKSHDAKKAKQAEKEPAAQESAKSQESVAAQDETATEDRAAAENGTANGAAGEPTVPVHNPQRLDCDYENNNVFMPVNVAITVFGDSTAKQNIGNICPQTGPSFDD
ncbi:hypothetical protein [Streptomyces meridianus]|uniref:Secreted protein n=1 Tax=Streptomyces meridianus TaxID=2938945 RepID=A0ABT0X1F0_9ACTN|nr:hypothetical protein [Streptomyces meridianus]MCM2576120.1 hypothetical protein [Streptomyces meridianus]